MKILTKFIIKEHLPPFIIAMAVLTFLFLSNFIVKSIDKLLGKGLSVWVIMEYIFLNLMWILALSIPMAVLVAILMSYGRMSADNEITALRASGVSFLTIVRPSMIFGIIVCLSLIYFNNNILPDFNHRARLLGSDIYRKKPDLSIEPGYFIDDLPQYSLLVKEKSEGLLRDILIYSKGDQEEQTTIKAESGSLSVSQDKIIMTLFNGEIHTLDKETHSEYQLVDFQKHILSFDAPGMVLQRRDSGRRGDREMSSKMMLEKVEEIQADYDETMEKIRHAMLHRVGIDTPLTNEAYILNLTKMTPDSVMEMRFNREGIDSLSASTRRSMRREIRSGLQQISTQMNLSKSYERQINKYLVEVHKKYSIPVACIVFVLIGAPLGVMARHGGFAVGAGFSLFFFLVYWAGLIGGEELADRLIVSPFIAMWTPNLVVGFFGVMLTIRTVRERSTLEWGWISKLRRKKRDDETTEDDTNI
jgi:lipopolysaccharide export system permease protein